jgi:hypothetical protein
MQGADSGRFGRLSLVAVDASVRSQHGTAMEDRLVSTLVASLRCEPSFKLCNSSVPGWCPRSVEQPSDDTTQMVEAARLRPWP